jgi:hypothetical protein
MQGLLQTVLDKNDYADSCQAFFPDPDETIVRSFIDGLAVRGMNVVKITPDEALEWQRKHKGCSNRGIVKGDSEWFRAVDTDDIFRVTPTVPGLTWCRRPHPLNGTGTAFLKSGIFQYLSSYEGWLGSYARITTDIMEAMRISYKTEHEYLKYDSEITLLDSATNKELHIGCLGYASYVPEGQGSKWTLKRSSHSEEDAIHAGDEFMLLSDDGCILCQCNDNYNVYAYNYGNLKNNTWHFQRCEQ